MNRIMILAASAAAIMLTCSCQKKEMDIKPGKGGIVSVTASIGDFNEDTRTYIDGTESSPKTYWSENDSILMFDSNGASAVYKISNWKAKQTSAEFRLAEGQAELFGTVLFAAYPVENAWRSDSGITFNLPASQNYEIPEGGQEGTVSFGNGAAPMIGRVSSDNVNGDVNLTFQNVCGVLQLNFKSSEVISRIAVASLSENDFICGKYNIGIPEDPEQEPVCSFSTGNYQVSMDVPEKTASAGTSRSYYFVIPHRNSSETGEFTFRVAVTTEKGLYYKDVKTTMARSQITSLASIEVNESSFTCLRYPEAPDSAVVIVEGLIWAPVNCGYEPSKTGYKGFTYGKMFQWGRKYGQGYGDDGEGYEGDASWPNNDDTTLVELNSPLTDHPDLDSTSRLKFYRVDDDYSNWYDGTDPDPEKLWGAPRTAYDPCPEGWRVPTKDEMGSLVYLDWYSLGVYGSLRGEMDYDRGGWDYGGGLFFPAAGYSSGDMGASYPFNNRGSDGNYATSTTYENGIYILRFPEPGYDPIDYGSRVDELSVRCVYGE